MGNTPASPASEPRASSAVERSMVTNPPGTAPVGTEAAETEPAPPAEAPQETPAAPETPAADQPDTAAEATTEEAADSEAVSEESAATSTGYDQLLPFETADTYPLELLSLAGQKFGVNPEGLADNKPMMDMLTSMVTKDIMLRNQKYDAELAAADVTTDAETEVETASATATPSDVEVDAQTEKDFGTAFALAKQQVSPKSAELYATHMAKVNSDLDAAYKSKDKAKITQAERGYVESQAAMANLIVNDVLSRSFPQLMEHHLEKYISGREEQKSAYSKARELVFSDPKLGTDAKKFFESGKFDALIEKHPEIAEKQFSDAQGKALPPVQNAVQQYRMATALLRGESMESPQRLAEATQAGLEAGRKNSAEVNQRAGAGAFGKGGRSTGTLGTGGGESDDDFMKGLVDADARRNPMKTRAFAQNN